MTKKGGDNFFCHTMMAEVILGAEGGTHMRIDRGQWRGGVAIETIDLWER